MQFLLPDEYVQPQLRQLICLLLLAAEYVPLQLILQFLLPDEYVQPQLRPPFFRFLILSGCVHFLPHLQFCQLLIINGRVLPQLRQLICLLLLADEYVPLQLILQFLLPDEYVQPQLRPPFFQFLILSGFVHFLPHLQFYQLLIINGCVLLLLLRQLFYQHLPEDGFFLALLILQFPPLGKDALLLLIPQFSHLPLVSGHVQILSQLLFFRLPPPGEYDLLPLQRPIFRLLHASEYEYVLLRQRQLKVYIVLQSVIDRHQLRFFPFLVWRILIQQL